MARRIGASQIASIIENITRRRGTEAGARAFQRYTRAARGADTGSQGG